ncbi:hypothetical protein A3K48_04140 [candidate division WOR-1 bacterium RIFOXYA12_FULL_52_29]|uniref:Uncharacterized protein n=1 Tax=candidate division WOR-1 bacterium RIFOXYC12_FULL_54_18 TaxID=1802584 RepID=A0A1F4T6G5_UNCSA|nr:MAG: hypothetical protein A3K44_04140 [candidate division WOR-1 bacterium RIFOXYA2_FULL_51_19]OGC17743.1 MAG: hypothetical protein A3K48_04140 [candidate division WOR-1 bacterium RIFOXYA12_FULL_52_29]OGC26600.1 MAG: hypothetical protein A3K32_04135 [candidate division WOR-1 bacterium RIFOXYB2_FULL_45_9]OGC28160.1 MAG: hypothetical protein A3K49_04140 [candidate division WOR-1 bacterium RIFOXYC12_FULL_54_18]OGC29554.1 MAG: hypothetical protein A2346_02195 [candidate division WOR-1 bacterium R
MKNILIYLFLLLSFSFFGCGQFNASPSTGPIFTDPAVKLAELSRQDFTLKLYYEAIAREPRL